MRGAGRLAGGRRCGPDLVARAEAAADLHARVDGERAVLAAVIHHNVVPGRHTLRTQYRPHQVEQPHDVGAQLLLRRRCPDGCHSLRLGLRGMNLIRHDGDTTRRYSKVNTYASAPGSSKVICRVCSRTSPSWRMSWYSRPSPSSPV